MSQAVHSTPPPAGQATDPRAQQVAAVYAKAFLAAAAKTGQTEALIEELDSFVDDVLLPLPGLSTVLASQQVPAKEKQSMLDRTLGGKAAPTVLNFLKVLAEHERLDCLSAIQRAVRDQHDLAVGRVRVSIETAAPIEGPQLDRLVGVLRDMLRAEPYIASQINPEIIGGLVLRVGDTVYDASVASQLKQVYGQMINRSVHEIQSRRDRFSHPTGD